MSLYAHGAITMTENEKAATFVGWKPGMLTTRRGELPAPDMTQPENWTRALETVRKLGYEWSLGGRPSLERYGLKDARLITGAIWAMGRPDLCKESYGDSNRPGDIGGTVVKMLANLYDQQFSSRGEKP